MQALRVLRLRSLMISRAGIQLCFSSSIIHRPIPISEPTHPLGEIATSKIPELFDYCRYRNPVYRHVNRVTLFPVSCNAPCMLSLTFSELTGVVRACRIDAIKLDTGKWYFLHVSAQTYSIYRFVNSFCSLSLTFLSIRSLITVIAFGDHGSETILKISSSVGNTFL